MGIAAERDAGPSTRRRSPAGQRSSDDSTRRLIDATVLLPPQSAPVEERMRERAVEAVMSGTRWLPAAEVGRRRQPESSNPHAALSRWLDQGRIFALVHRGNRIYASYAFDELGEPVPALRGVLQALKGYTPFRVAAWFESTNAWLDGKRPREVLATRGDEVIAAAQRHALGPVHG